MNNESKQIDASNKSRETVNYGVPFFKLFSFADSTDKILMIIGTIGAIGNGISQPLLAVLLGDVTDSFGRNIRADDIVPVISKVCLKFVYLALGTGVAAFLQVACWMTTGERQATRIRCKYLKTILRQDISFFDTETKTGEIVSSMSGDIVLLQDAIGEKVGKCIQLYVTFIGGFAIAFGKRWLLTLVMLTSIVPMVVSGGIFAILISRMSPRVHKAYSKAAVVVEQTISSIRTVASFTGEKRAITDYNKALDAAYTSSVSQGLTTGMGLGSLLSIVFCAFSLATFYGGKLVADKKITAADFLTVIIAMLIGSSALGQASPCVTAFARGRSAAFRIIQTIKRKPTIDAHNTSGKSPDEIHGIVELKDVYFSYPSRPDEPIFKGFSLFIPKGNSTALVGHSGSGKSTVINLIERFYDPQEGEVLIDGINIKEFQLMRLREKIALVSQEPVLFMASIKDNIAYGKPSATIDEIMMALDTANASNFINQLPEGMETMVGEHGAQLSGGQKQRVAIARAILKDPRILLLDEATSALDAESERMVQNALDKIMVSRTTVIVAHRLRTIRNSNMIAVFDQGKIVEKGTHSELSKDERGVYSQLIRLQEVNHENEQRFEEDDQETNNSQEFSSETMTMSSDDDSTNIKLEAYLHMSDNNDPVPGKEKGPLENPICRLAYLNKHELPALVGGTIASIVNGAVLPILGMLIAEALKTFYEPKHKLEKNSRHLALKFLFTGFLTLLAYPTSGYLFGVAGSKLVKRIRSMCFEKVVYMEAGWFDQPENSSGVIGAKLSADVANLNALIGDALAQIVQVTSSIVTGLIVAFDASWELTLIILAMIPMLGLNGYVLLKFTKGFSEDSKGMYEEASQIVNDAVGSIRIVASYCAEGKVVDLYQTKCEVPMKKGIRQGLLSGIFFGSSSAMLFLVYSTGFYAGARLIKDGKISFSDVFQVLFAVILSFTAISATTSMAPDSNKAKSAALSIFSILDLKQKINSKDELGTTLESVKGEIIFQHVSFRYPTRPDIYVLQDLSLTIYSGKTVALVGESGSGKSTVISLLQRFYDPESGHITLDGIKLQNFQLKWLRQQMGLVSQEPVLFNDTVRANISYGKDEGSATEADILTAAEVANAHNFISGLQNGYETMVGERGIQLSGGQKQRIAIARAFIKHPKILLLDEATSALDTESERIVQDALKKVIVNRTTIIVAHRLSTIKNADLIVVVKNGCIVEKGTHETLANIEGGLYASLVALHMNNDGSSL